MFAMFEGKWEGGAVNDKNGEENPQDPRRAFAGVRVRIRQKHPVQKTSSKATQVT